MTITFDEPTSEPAGGHHEPRRRAVGAVAAVAVVALALGAGFALGRAVADGASSAGAQATLPDVADPAADGDVGNTDADGHAPVASASPVSPVPDTTSSYLDQDAGAEYASDAAFDSGAGMSASGGTGYTLFGPQPMAPLIERTTPDGYTLRVQKSPEWDHGSDWGIAGWEPAPWCYESAQLRVTISGPGITDVGAVSWFREPYQGRAISSVLLGVADGSPRWVVVVQVPGDASNVSVQFADGSTDTAVPSNGVAVLTVPAAEGPIEVNEGGGSYWRDPEPSFAVTIDGGASAGVVGSDGTGTWADNDYRDACSPPPPALPDAGEQPADPGAARQAIEEAMDVLYGSSDVADRDTLIDDPTGVADARQQVAEGSYAEQAASASAVVEELVFTAPGEAWFRYRIEAAPSVFDNRYGIAREVNGTWKITRDTLCQDLTLAGGDCGPGWQPVTPPSMREQAVQVIGEPGEIWSSEGE